MMEDGPMGEDNKTCGTGMEITITGAVSDETFAITTRSAIMQRCSFSPVIGVV